MNTSADIVDSLLHPCASLVRQLLDRTQRSALNLFVIDDEENILQALSAGIGIESVFYAGGEVISETLKSKLTPGTKIYEVAKRTCKKIFENDKLTRIFAIARAPQRATLESLAGKSQDIVIIEDVSISGNVGAIIRTAVAFGIGGIVLTNLAPVDVYDRRLIRASRGLLFALPVAVAPTEEVILFCKQRNFTIAVTDPQASTLIDELSSIPDRLFIAFGSEREGCSTSLIQAAGLEVRIPTTARVESLNVSAAASIVLYNRLRFNNGHALPRV
jgi:23S rRNA (adenosine1067-2'-O)-methyltransferase